MLYYGTATLQQSHSDVGIHLIVPLSPFVSDSSCADSVIVSRDEDLGDLVLVCNHWIPLF